MASVFPGAIDSFTDPLSGSALNSPSHSAQHADLNSAANKIETYMGLVKVVPTSVTNGTVSATGTVTIGTAVSSVTVSGCFSSLYDNYKIIVNGGTANTSAAITFQLGASVTGYYANFFYAPYATGAFTTAPVNNGANWSYAGEASTNMITMNLELANPFNAKFTNLNGTYNGTVGGFISGYHGVATSYNSFIIASGAVMTGGTLRVYGYRN